MMMNDEKLPAFQQEKAQKDLSALQKFRMHVALITQKNEKSCKCCKLILAK